MFFYILEPTRLALSSFPIACAIVHPKIPTNPNSDKKIPLPHLKGGICSASKSKNPAHPKIPTNPNSDKKYLGNVGFPLAQPVELRDKNEAEPQMGVHTAGGFVVAPGHTTVVAVVGPAAPTTRAVRA